MNAAEKLIREYVKATTEKTFTFATDIAEHTIWGFKGARYRTFSRALQKVNTVLQSMEDEGTITVDRDVENGVQPIIHSA